MAVQLHNRGEQFLMRDVFAEDVDKPTEVTVGLYNDSSDTLGDGSTLGAITTEPSGSSYARQSVSFGSEITVFEDENGDWVAELDDVVFDVSDSSITVDSVFVAAYYQYYGAANKNDELIFTCSISQSTDLSQNNGILTTQDMGISID